MAQEFVVIIPDLDTRSCQVSIPAELPPPLGLHRGLKGYLHYSVALLVPHQSSAASALNGLKKIRPVRAFCRDSK